MKKRRQRAQKVNLFEGQIWKAGKNSIEIISCNDEFGIVEAKLSNSCTSREFAMITIQMSILEYKMKEQK